MERVGSNWLSDSGLRFLIRLQQRYQLGLLSSAGLNWPVGYDFKDGLFYSGKQVSGCWALGRRERTRLQWSSKREIVP